MKLPAFPTASGHALARSAALRPRHGLFVAAACASLLALGGAGTAQAAGPA